MFATTRHTCGGSSLFRIPNRVAFRGRNLSTRLVAAIAGIALVGAGTATANAVESSPRLRSVLLDDMIVVSAKEFPASASLTLKATVKNGSGQTTSKTNSQGRALAGFTLPEGFTGLVSLVATSGTASATTSVTVPGADTTTPGSVVPTTAPTTATTKAPTASGVLFEDDFSGAAHAKPDASKWSEWSACTYNGSAAYGNIKCGNRSTLDGQGHLSIPASPTEGTSISTKDNFTFTYGTMTARMKVPTQAGYWPAFWSLNNNPNGSDASVLGEIDVHESYTGLANYYHIATHTWGTTAWSAKQDPSCGLNHVFGEWHDYSAKVEPGRISFYFDGAMCGTYATKDETAGRPYGFGPDTTRGNWPILTLAVGGAGGQQDGKATQPAALLVDSVEVRAL